MRKTITAFVLATSIALGGCAGGSIFQGGSSLTESITNPVGRNELAAVENAYGIVLSAAVNYRRLGICAKGASPTISAPCASREVVLQLQLFDRNAHAALLTARTFIKMNPTISAVSVISAARKAVEDFRLAASVNGAI